MALFTSAGGKFEITALSMTPSAALYGGTATISVTLKNLSGVAITATQLIVHVVYRNIVTDAMIAAAPDLGLEKTGIIADFLIKSASGGNWVSGTWANNAEKTFTGTFTFQHDVEEYDIPGYGLTDVEAPDMSQRLLQPGLTSDRGFTLLINYKYGSNKTGRDAFDQDLSNGFTRYVVVYAQSWRPAASLSVRRCTVSGGAATPSDEGERLMLTASISCADAADTSQMYCRLYYAQDAPPTDASPCVDLTAHISDLLTGVTDDATLVTQTFSNGIDWYFALVFGDVAERGTASASAARAFANLHLSGQPTGGAAFGRFSSSALNDPKLESEYPIYPYAGIEGVNNYAAGDALTGGHWLGSPIRRAVFADTGVTATGAVAVGTLAETPAVVLSVTGCYYRAADTMFRPLPFISYASINWAVSAVVHDDGSVELYFGSSNTGSKDYVLVVDYVASV